jgi:hypothetical protein
MENAMDATLPFLDVLKRSAEYSASAEDEFRRHIVERTKALERQRSFAFRRLNLMHAVTDVIAQAESEEIAVAGAAVVLRSRLGWASDSDARTEVVSRFAPVARAMFVSFQPPEDVEEDRPDVVEKLAEFEAWYEQTHPNSFWFLFENHMPETPVVDF